MPARTQEMSPTSGETGLLVEEVAKLRVTTTTWQIIYKIDLQPHRVYCHMLRASLRKFAGVCRANCSLEYGVGKLTEMLDEAEKNLEGITQSIQDNRRAKRDAPLAVIGKIQKVLFGTLDEESKAQLEKLIDDANLRSSGVAKLFAKQTSIIKTEFASIQEQLNQTWGKLDELVGENDEIKTKVRANEVFEIISEAILQYEIQTQAIIEGIIWAEKGIIYPKLFPMGQVRETLRTMKETMMNVDFLADIDTMSVVEVQEMSKISIVYVETFLTYILEIPLLETTTFDLYKLHALPSRERLGDSTDIFAFIRPKFEYIAISADKNTYIPVNLETLQSCIVQENTYICGDVQPTRELGSSASCEAKIVVNQSPDPDSCSIEIIKLTQTYWVRLAAKNTWAFAAPKPERIFMACRQKELTSMTLLDTGVIKLREGCVAQTASASLMATQAIRTTFTGVKIQEIHFNMTNLIEGLVQKVGRDLKDMLDQNVEKTANSKRRAKELKVGIELRDLIEEAENIAKYREIERKFSTYSISMGIIITIIIITMVIGIVWSRKRCLCPGGAPLLIACRKILGKKKQRNSKEDPEKDPSVGEERVREKPAPRARRDKGNAKNKEEVQMMEILLAGTADTREQQAEVHREAKIQRKKVSSSTNT